ncbi:MAG: class I SAM-dependent methyltransferase [Halobacteriaceae archaeon]
MDGSREDDDLRRRIADQFSGRGERAGVWRTFGLFLETDAFLNLGHSPRVVPHVVGDPQARLARVVGERLVAALGDGADAPETAGVEAAGAETADVEAAGSRVLDVGCGRGGPAVEFASSCGFDVTGVDLVPHNVAAARATAREADVEPSARPSFLVGDATRLPVRTGAVDGATAVDALVYVPERERVFAELGRVVAAGGAVVLTDLVRAPDLSPADRRAVERFAAAWDMPLAGTTAGYRAGLADAGFDRVRVVDLSRHSVGRFRRWTTAYGLLSRTPAGWLLDRWLEGRDVDAAAVREQVRRAHAALPHLRHVLVVAQRH